MKIIHAKVHEDYSEGFIVAATKEAINICINEDRPEDAREFEKQLAIFRYHHRKQSEEAYIGALVKMLDIFIYTDEV